MKHFYSDSEHLTQIYCIASWIITKQMISPLIFVNKENGFLFTRKFILFFLIEQNGYFLRPTENGDDIFEEFME